VYSELSENSKKKSSADPLLLLVAEEVQKIIKKVL
jgi:hypothetical protein